VVPCVHNSGTLVRPRITHPAASSRSTSHEVVVARWPASFAAARPSWYGSPACVTDASFTTIGTPASGASLGQVMARAASIARSKRGWITALIARSRASMRAIDSPTVSSADRSPRRIAAAMSIASSCMRIPLRRRRRA
jgi:hypothetical protein